MSNAKASFSENDDKVKRALLGKGKFILATNELEKLSDEEVLKQKKLREALLRENQMIPDQKEKPTKKPTMRRVFQIFEGITVLYENGKRVMIMNINALHRKILALFGTVYERIYCVDAA
ncbi:MAG: hypothetical protein M5U10_09255 [Candidatus Methanoperedens sp.]|nr:hypothetical protein [Candidatus Methanoperedens sp.]